MKNSPTDSIRAALKKVSDLELEIPALSQQLSAHAAELAELAANGNLNDEKDIARIGRLQILTNLFPARITARENALETALDDLLKTCHAFISVANPRAGTLTRQMFAKVKAELKAHFADADQLDRAANQSTLVIECQNLNFTFDSNPINGPVGYAHGLLAGWDKLTALEAKL